LIRRSEQDTTRARQLRASQNGAASPGAPSVWGLAPEALHDRYWASFGVQVVRPGVPAEIVEGAELFLLLGTRLLTLFPLRPAVDKMNWLHPQLLCVRLSDQRPRGYRERAEYDEQGRFVRFAREYTGIDARLARVGITRSRAVAEQWQLCADEGSGWRHLRRYTSPKERWVISLGASTYDRHSDSEVAAYLHELAGHWRRPDLTIDRVREVHRGVWADEAASVDRAAVFCGNAWVGAGRQVEPGQGVVGPAILWDQPEAAPNVSAVRWDDLEPVVGVTGNRRGGPTAKPADGAARRVFDVFFALAALALTLPLYPLIMLAIYLESGRPFFFAHQRETIGGRPFPCIKFRSMRQGAEQMRKQLRDQNQADGPQFYIDDDPRVTRVGRFLRRYHLDELPQFLNVLAGHMSVVGPRPSPRNENQYCPGWRETRLSVKPGVTGLWQVSRTRENGNDFQEWIRFDLQYVEQQSLKLDLWIICKTVGLILRGKASHGH
jgi:lipopolysaccharide/colanic/teichoic acid biosynthesis glycosyltransferase